MTLAVCTTPSLPNFRAALRELAAGSQAVHLVVTHRPFFLEAQEALAQGRFPLGSTLRLLLPSSPDRLPFRDYSSLSNAQAGRPLEGRMWCAQPRVRRLLRVRTRFLVVGEFMVVLAASLEGLSESEFVLRAYSSLDPGEEPTAFWRRVGEALAFLEGKDCATLLNPVIVTFPVGTASVVWVKELRSDYVGAKWWRGPCPRFKATETELMPVPQFHSEELFVCPEKKK